jgi:hypothetical protein
MGMQQYIHVIEEYCRQADILAVDAIVDDGLVEVQGTRVRLRYAESCDQLSIQVELAPPAEAFALELYLTMLESNDEIEEHVQIFGVDAATGNCSLTWRIALSDLQSEYSLLNIMDQRVGRVVACWQDTLAELDLSATPLRGAEATKTLLHRLA